MRGRNRWAPGPNQELGRGLGPFGLGGLVALAALVATVPSARAGQPAAAKGGAEASSGEGGEPTQDEPVDEATRRGREAFQRGVALVREVQWGDALAAFEEAAKARNAPIVQFNIAICLRALGRYVAARAVTQPLVAHPDGLADSQLEEARGYLAEYEALIVRVAIHLEPQTAQLTVDGRPLVPVPGQPASFLAGVAPPGPGKAPGRRELTVELDPGAHLFRAARAGHADALVQQSYRAGERTTLDLRLDRLPATVAIRSEPPQAIVRVDGREVGLAPVEFERPAGQYDLEVELDDYDPYTAALDLQAGQRADLTATLVPYEQPVYETWWFWTGAVAVVAGGVVLTYFLARPSPEPPPYDGGSTGWVVQPSGAHF